MRRTTTTATIFVAALTLASAASAQESNIEPKASEAWGENIGWTDWYVAGAGQDGVVAGAFVLGGRVWAENIGWITLGDGKPESGLHYKNLAASDHGVNLDHVTGLLSGFGWGENVGWINFDTASLGADAARFDPCTHEFSGYAWGENVGWIRLEGANGASLDVTHATKFLGPGKPGTGGLVPRLCGYGHSGAGDFSTIVLQDAAPNAPALLVVGLQSNPTPYVDGLLYPVPIQFVLPLSTDPNGQIVFPAPGVAGPPIGVALQYVIGDPGATFGQSLSNGMILNVGL